MVGDTKLAADQASRTCPENGNTASEPVTREQSPKRDQAPSASIYVQQAAETHFCRRRLQAHHRIRDHFTHHWSMFETVARASANNPDVLRFGMAVQNEIVVCGVSYSQTRLSSSGEPAIAGRRSADRRAPPSVSPPRISRSSGGLDVYPDGQR